MPRVDIQEGDLLPYGWVAWGDIKPMCGDATMGWYFMLRLPFYRYGQGWLSGEPQWWQTALLYRRLMPKGREGQCGEWRVCELHARGVSEQA